uniref:Uncharacterized protein n=1 Tax=Ophidocladus simpliciusculus TaxID=1261574 RepID=A0A1Z1MJE9_9FLOR|nr:hypothetical protein [Ophidocladus simpliciusculus]ARW65972.1 hypothetical protein [Ophidocladus simpliciusculus]
MVSNLKNIYYDKYNLNNESEYTAYEVSDIEMPTGWSCICLDETINYYTDCNNKMLYSDNNEII